jgi:amino acid transporter
MIEGTPSKLWPARLGEIDKKTGTPKRGLIAQGLLVVIMITLITFGGSGALKFFETLQNMTNIAMTLPYLFISIAYIKYLKNDKIEKPFRVLSKNIKIGLLAGWAVTLVVAFANIFSVIDLDSADTGIMGLNIPFVYDQYILGPVIFAIISYLIVHNYEKRK